jgi:hypothetical protein
MIRVRLEKWRPAFDSRSNHIFHNLMAGAFGEIPAFSPPVSDDVYTVRFRQLVLWVCFDLGPGFWF